MALGAGIMESKMGGACTGCAQEVIMVLAVCVIIFFLSCYAEASAKDWELGQWLAERRADRIISAIGGASHEITSTYTSLFHDQIDYWDRFRQDMEKEKTFQDSHGRWYRKRLVYGSDGNLIAEEVVEIEG